MRPVSVFAKPPAPACRHLHQLPHHRWREATRAVMVPLSASGMSAAEIREALGHHPATVRRWIHRCHAAGLAGPASPGLAWAGRGRASASAAC